MNADALLALARYQEEIVTDAEWNMLWEIEEGPELRRDYRRKDPAWVAKHFTPANLVDPRTPCGCSLYQASRLFPEAIERPTAGARSSPTDEDARVFFDLTRDEFEWLFYPREAAIGKLLVEVTRFEQAARIRAFVAAGRIPR